jgi:hypothetical protein
MPPPTATAIDAPSSGRLKKRQPPTAQPINLSLPNNITNIRQPKIISTPSSYLRMHRHRFSREFMLNGTPPLLSRSNEILFVAARHDMLRYDGLMTTSTPFPADFTTIPHRIIERLFQYIS